MKNTNLYKAAFDKVTDEKMLFVRKRFIEICNGSHIGALFLTQALYWDGVMGGEFYKTNEDWMEELCMSKTTLETARKHAQDFVEVTKKGLPAKNFYRVNKEKIAMALAALPSLPSSSQGNPASSDREIPTTSRQGFPTTGDRETLTTITENTTEITSKNTIPEKSANADCFGETDDFSELFSELEKIEQPELFHSLPENESVIGNDKLPKKEKRTDRIFSPPSPRRPPSKRKTAQRILKAVSAQGLKMAEWFASTFPANVEITPRRVKEFASHFDELLARGKTEAEIMTACKYGRGDKFWKTNFFSPAKLLDKNDQGMTYFDVFTIKATAGAASPEKKQEPPPPPPKKQYKVSPEKFRAFIMDQYPHTTDERDLNPDTTQFPIRVKECYEAIQRGEI
jgi:hypothetical protein